MLKHESMFVSDSPLSQSVWFVRRFRLIPSEALLDDGIGW